MPRIGGTRLFDGIVCVIDEVWGNNDHFYRTRCMHPMTHAYDGMMGIRFVDWSYTNCLWCAAWRTK